MDDFFTSKGRIGRGTFFLRILAIWAAYIVCCFLVGFALGVAGVLTHSHFAESDVQLVVLLLMIPFGIMDILQVIKRSHDLNISGWYAVVTRIPFLGLLAYLPLFFGSGTCAANRFGENPSRPRSVVMTGAWAS